MNEIILLILIIPFYLISIYYTYKGISDRNHTSNYEERINCLKLIAKSSFSRIIMLLVVVLFNKYNNFYLLFILPDMFITSYLIVLFIYVFYNFSTDYIKMNKLK